ncbi:hypothetical protein OS493_012664 [Desmophyllum pertusum]|uniref:Uncharacterized protein n=1 Tax=Desmophyllum pertusum TaxID=174260 RepID=A0A9X0D042_9CNID|nr:hypothetical protein OS493_012664 [Desmophyllum pertusum]
MVKLILHSFKESEYKMRFVFAIISILLLFQPDVSLSCDTANWWGSFDREGWSVCPNDKTYLTDSGETTRQEIMAFSFSRKEVAAQPVTRVSPISLQPVETLTGFKRWMVSS